MILVSKILKSLGYSTVTEDIYREIGIWESWYRGKVRAFHSYTVFNGSNNVRCERYSLGMAKTVCEDWANMLLNEKTLISTGSEESTKEVDRVLDNNDFWVNGNQNIEKAFALGTGAFVLSLGSVNVDMDTGNVVSIDDDVMIDYATADHIYPLSWSKNKITECAFVYDVAQEGKKYYIISAHTINPTTGTYVVRNYAYNEYGQPTTIDGLIDEFDTESTLPWFYIFTPNIANNIYRDNPMGISVFANGIDCLKGCDLAYDGFCVEFQMGKKRIMVSTEATKVIDGQKVRVFDPNDIVFYELPTGIEGKTVIHEFNPSLRSEEFQTGIQQQLNLLSAKCGLGKKHYIFDSGSVATATQVISEKDDMFRNKKKHDIIIQKCLSDLVRGILYISKHFLRKPIDENADITIVMDDSIIEDKNSEMVRDLQLVSSGIMGKVEYRMKWFAEDENTAKQKIENAKSGATLYMSE